ncbi:MAG: hypothetical protein ABI409_03090 [Ramlibacter sp.]
MARPTKRSEARRNPRSGDVSNEDDGFPDTQVEERRTGEGADSALERLKIIERARARSGV